MNLTIFREIIWLCIVALMFLNFNRYKKISIKQKEINENLKLEIQSIKDRENIKNEIFVRVSHDIRTPVSNIVILITLLKNSLDDREKTLKYINKIENSAKYLLGLSNEIVDMRKIELGNIQIVSENINIKTVILDCFSMIEDKLKEKGIKFSKNIDKMKHIELVGDELRLHQIFINILINAINHTPKGGKITFSAKEIKRVKDEVNDNYVVSMEFKISDNGEGMHQEFLEHIWEPYSKDKNSFSQKNGTGLGMAITKQYVALMNGKIDVKSKVGVGSVFTIKLTFVENKENILNKKHKIA